MIRREKTEIKNKMNNKLKNLASLDMIMTNQKNVEEFWNHFADDGQPIRLACGKLRFEFPSTVETHNKIRGLRLAIINDLYRIVPIEAAMAEAESGINPLAVDSEEFINRCARRIIKNQIWILVENDKLIFKADLQIETPELIYFEGLYVSPEESETGLARRCYTQLCKSIMTRTSSTSMLVNDENENSNVFHRMHGQVC